MSDLALKPAVELARMLSSREISSRELTRTYADKIQASDAKIGAFISTDIDRALDQADEFDRRRAAGDPIGPLAGMPIAIKDALCTADLPTTCGSKILEGFQSPYEATVVKQLRTAGALVLGKTNMDEFAMGGSTETGYFGIARNPWDQSRTPGGSSGGAAASVAAGMIPLSIGSDTGGSIRQPAAFCGICGLKPTYGRVSRYGLVAFASSLDQVGPLAHSVEDLALLLDAISGHDPRDSTSIPEPSTQFLSRLTPAATQLAGQTLRVGIVKQHLEHSGLDIQSRQAVQQAIEVFEANGATIHEVELPHSEYAIATYYIIAPCEASSNLSRFDGAHYGYRSPEKSSALADSSPLLEMYCRSRGEAFGAEVKRRIMLGTYALSSGYYDAYYLKALKVRRLIRSDYDAALQQGDILIGPATPSSAFKIGEKIDDPVQMYLEDLYTVGANLAGIPAMSIPCGWNDQGLPIGLHMQAPPLGELQLLQAGYLYQQATNWTPRIAPLS